MFPPDHPAVGSIVLNMAANVLGLGNAATASGTEGDAGVAGTQPR